MNELIVALTRAANAVAEYYEKAANPLVSVAAATAVAVAAVAVEPKKERKARTPKEPAASTIDIDGPTPALVPASLLKDMSEAQSLAEVRAVAKLYVQRFGNQQDGIAAFRKLMADKFKVARIDDLVHAQRLSVIQEAKDEIAKADNTSRQPVGAGVEV